MVIGVILFIVLYTNSFYLYFFLLFFFTILFSVATMSQTLLSGEIQYLNGISLAKWVDKASILQLRCPV